MPRFHRKKITKDAAGIKHGFRSGLEKKIISDLEELGIVQAFDRKIHVPNLTKNEIANVLKNYDCDNKEREQIANLVQNSPIKQLCFLIDRALQKNPVLQYEFLISEINGIIELFT